MQNVEKINITLKSQSIFESRVSSERTNIFKFCWYCGSRKA